MEQYFKVVIKVQYEDKKGNTKYKKENYIVSGISPTDVETKIQKFLSISDYDIISISIMNIIDIIK